jgi:hypothetical protein
MREEEDMKTELVVAIIAGVVALGSAGGTIWSSVTNTRHSDANTKAIEELKIANDRTKAAAQREKEISIFREPLARSAYDLQSRLYNILKQNLIQVFLVGGNDRERSYVTNNTAFLIGQYLCWTELVRRKLQFIDLGESSKTKELLDLQDNIYGLWGTDAQPPLLRIFAGEQRAIGEALISTNGETSECMGYGAFLTTFTEGKNPLIDAIKADILSLETVSGQANERLTNLQHALIDLLGMLDPNFLRFPEKKRSKV